ANKFTPTLDCGEARAKYVAGELKEGGHVEIAGRITAHRDMGKSQFMDLRDVSGRIQIYAQKQTLGDEQFDIFKHLDLGDFIGVKGELFTTKAGEPTMKITSFVILAKALRPPPAKWHGLEDTEIRYRQRYLDLIGNPDVKEVFLKRSAIVHEIRAFFHSRGYVEVETPAMQAIPGGAAAQPFKTFHNALGCDFYLRIALELYHKRLLVGGIDKLFEIGKNFRNEGLSRRHNPEFTMLGAYQAFGDYETMMEFVEELIKHVAEKVLGKLKIEHDRSPEVARAINQAIHFVEGKALAAYRLALRGQIDPHRQEVIETDATGCLSKLKTAAGNIGKEPSHEVAKEAWSALDSFLPGYAVGRGAPDLGDAELNNILKEFDAARATLHALCSQKIIDLTPNWRRAKYKDLVREEVAKKTKNKISDWF